MNNNFLTLLGTVLLAFLVASPSYANHTSSYDYARVTRVAPAYEYYTVRKPKRHCEYVRADRHNQNRAQRHFIRGESITHGRSTTHRSNTTRNNSSTSRLRNSRNNHINRTNRISRNNRHAGNNRNRLVKHCVTKSVSHQKRRLVGYNVTYVYRGDYFQTRTNQHPGNRIRLHVQTRLH